jgi:hypothetical protein
MMSEPMRRKVFCLEKHGYSTPIDINRKHMLHWLGDY